MEDLDALLADLQNSINPNARLGSPAGRVSSPGGRISSGRASSPGGSLGSPSSVGAGYGSINGTRNINVEYEKKATPSPTYQNTGILREKTPPAKSYSSGSYASTPPSNTGTYGRTGKPAANLSELDTLLDDLSNARYAGYAERNTYSAEKTDSGYGRANGSISPAVTPTTPRPTVDSLLDQLSTDVHNGGTHYHHHHPSQPTKKVVVTVQETVVEPADVQHLHQHTHPHQHVVHTHVPHASNATKELDDLMASLSDFKVSSAHHRQVLPSGQQVYEERRVLKEQHSTGPNHQHESLEYMLGSLKEDMSRQGVQTPQKGCCNACDKPIVGQVITALGRTWHPEHFTCAHCQQELGTRNFFERDGKPYCEPDYHNLFSPRCAYCNGPILDKCVTALDKTWHTEHFFCAQCGQQFGEDGFHERDGKPYCRNDYFDMFAPKCGGCNRPIMENYISALNLQWHPDCFVCKDCHEPFHGGSFYDHEGYPYCETHYHAKRGSLCAGCHKPIAGRCVTAMFRKFHPEHFVCAFCLKQLNKGTFKEQNDKPYCHVCFDKLFG